MEQKKNPTLRKSKTLRAFLRNAICGDLLDRLRDPVIIIGMDQKIAYWNKAAEQTYGYRSDEAVSCNADRILEPLYGDVIRGRLGNELKESGHVQVNSMRSMKDGRKVRVETEATLHQDKDEGSTFIVLVDRVVSSSMEAGTSAAVSAAPAAVQNEEGLPLMNKQLQEQAAELEAARSEAVNQRNRSLAIMDALPVGVAIVDEKGGRLDSNPAYDQIWGGSPPPVKSIEDYPSYKAWWTDSGKPIEAEEWASAQALKTGEAVLGQLLKIQRFDGGHAYVLNSAAPVRDASGAIVGSAVAIQDVSGFRNAEQVLRKRESELQLVMDIMPSLVAYIDREFRYKKVNKQYERWFGLTPRDVEGRFVWDVVGLDGWLLVRPELERVLAGESVTYEQEMPYKHGGSRWVQTTCVPDCDEQGFVRGFLANVADISGRKRIEAELRLSEEKARSLIRHAPTGIYEISFEGPRFLSVNDVMCYHLGYTREELLKMNPYDILDEQGRKAFQERVVDRLAGKPVDDFMEYIVRAKDGREIHVVLNMTLTYRDGKPLGALVIAHDITERKRHEVERERLLAEVTQYAAETGAILAAQIDPVLTYDSSGTIIRANPSFRVLYGFDPVGLNMKDVAIAAGLRTMEGNPMQWDDHPTPRALQGEKTVGAPFRVKRKDGSEGIIQISSGPMYIGDGGSGAVAVWHDITSIRKMEQTLKEQESHFRLAIEHMDMVVWQCDRNLRFTSLSRPYLGHPESDFLGKTLAEVMGHAIAEESTELRREVLKRGAGMRRTISFQFSDGGEQYFDEQVQPTRNEDGEIVGLIGLGLDVTEQMRAEQHLRRSEEGLRLMMKHSLEATLLLDESGLIEYVSDPAAGSLGFKEQELTGTNVERFIDWSTKLDLVMRVNEFKRHVPSPGRATMRLRRKDGSWVWLDLNATVMNFGQKPEKYLVKFQVIETARY